ncbi:MAG TPA: hypothetical protein VGP47_11155, partial [Parachlamydiaceae bacterium]|nr:hypothetical protein [Parachlamydiaceae bacterium]
MKTQITDSHHKKSILVFVLLMLFFSHLKASEAENTPQTSESLLHSPYLCQSVNVITGDYCEAATDFSNPSDPYLKIRRCFSNEEGWYFNLPLIQSPIPGDSDSPFTYNYDCQDRLSSVFKNGSKMPSIQISYPEQTSGMALQINETTLSYEFEKPDIRNGVPSFQIKRLCRDNTELCRYSYRAHPSLRKHLLERKDECNGNFLINEYYDKKINQVGDATIVIDDPVRDPLIGRIKLQKGPVGTDQTPVITARYFYYPGYTEVFDALDRKIVYHYQSDRLTATEYYNEGYLYRTERLFWEKDKQREIWNLTAKSWEDSQGKAIKCQTFTYDSEGNQTSETLYGSLSGKDAPSPDIDDKGVVRENGVESYSIRRAYTEDATSRFVTESHDNGKVVTHAYDKKTALKIAEFTGNAT